ncbi:hypothetical protein [Bradyrhizobium sp. USDA 4471]
MGLGRSRDYLLADYYLKAAGVALVWIDRNGHIGAQDVAQVEIDAQRVGYCCVRGAHFVLAYRLQLWREEQPAAPPPAAIAARLEQLAVEGGVSLTAHQLAAERALAAVATVEQMMEAMKQAGELREMNAAFKAARSADPSIKYVDLMNAKKAALLESIARRAS